MSNGPQLWHTAICPAAEPCSPKRDCTCGFDNIVEKAKAQEISIKAAQSQQPPVKELAFGKLKHDEDAWCEVCAKTTIWYGLILELKEDGVDVFGTTRGCHICKDWVRKDLNGKIIDFSKAEATKKENS